MDGRIFFLRSRLLDNLEHQWTIKEMADYTELSASHLQKLIKIQTGTSPIVFLRELRLERARELLETTLFQVNQVGCKIGMPNDDRFTRDFKNKYGVTPTEYRKIHSKGIRTDKQDGRKQ